MTFRHPNSNSGTDASATLVGRNRERSILRRWLRDALAGTGGVLLLGGEAGIGKTRLVQHVAERAGEHDTYVFIGHSYDLTTNLPFSPWIEILRSAREIDDLSPFLDDLAETDLRDMGGTDLDLPSQFVHYFRQIANHKPTVLVLEDLHWSDTASQDLLRVLGREAAHSSLLIIGTYRDDELTRGGALYRSLPHIVRESRALRMTLQRLDMQSTRAIVEQRYNLSDHDRERLASYLHELSDGNPFFIHELLDALEEELLLRSAPDGWTLAQLKTPVVPPLVEQIVEGRLDRLDPTTRRLLETAAAIGDHVPIDLWQAVSEVDEAKLIQAVREAGSSRLLEEMPGRRGLHFSHAIVREVLYKRVVLPERQALHERIAEQLQEVPSPDAGVIGHHFALADDPRAIEWLIRAARRANALHAPRTAIDTVSELLLLAENFAIPVSTEAYAIRGQARSTIGDFEGAKDDYEQVLSSASAAGNYEWAGEPYVSLGMLWADRDSRQLDKYLHTALALARESNEQIKVSHSLNRLGNWLLNICRPEEAIVYHEEALAVSEEIGDLDATATSLQLLGMTNMIRGDLIQAADYYQRAIDLFTALNKPNHLSYSLANLLNCALSLANDTIVPAPINVDDLMDPDGVITRLARDGGWPLRELYGLQIISLSWGFLGEYGTALDIGKRALAIGAEQEHRQWSAHINWRLGILYLNMMAAEEAREYINRGLEIARDIGAEIHIRAATGLLASAHILAGDLDCADELLGNFEVREDSKPATNQDRYSWCAYIDLALARGEPERALEGIDRLLQVTPNVGPERGVARLSKLRGEALFAMGKLDDAEVELRRARSEAVRLNARPMLWRIDALSAHLHLAMGEQDQAAAFRESATSIVDSLGNTIADKDLRSRFVGRACELMPRREEPQTVRPDADASFGLTERELEVLQLVARGLTDSEVGEKLYISPRTVNAHMRSIHRKLDVTSRAAATRHAVKYELI